jgi:predicted Ser/Thr protein kinase
MHSFVVPPSLASWATHSLESGQNVLATSNQGTILLYREGGQEFVVKTAMGKGAVLRARRKTLRREAAAYQRLAGLAGVPQFYGMVDERFLLLEFIHGQPYRDALIADRQAWFDALLHIIQGFHGRGVAHGDLKTKSNLMMTADGQPCVIDFGTTFIHRSGFHPLGNRLFEYARQLDLNAWVKHKYEGRYQDASPADRALLKYSALERWLREWRIRKWTREDRERARAAAQTGASADSDAEK